jgi:hypothetical protein
MGGCCLSCVDPGEVGQVLLVVSIIPKDCLVWACQVAQFLRCKSRIRIQVINEKMSYDGLGFYAQKPIDKGGKCGYTFSKFIRLTK